MADLGINKGWLVSPNAEVERKWIDVQIQEKKSRIVRWRQDIEDLTKGKILDLECRIAMAEKEIVALQNDKNAIVIEGVDNG